MCHRKSILVDFCRKQHRHLSEAFEAQGFSTRKSLKYLDEADLDYLFSSPKKLRLAEKRAITQELQQLKQQLFSDVDKSPTSAPTGTPLTVADSPLEQRKMELVENVSFLEAQASSAEEYLSQMRRENDLLQIMMLIESSQRGVLSPHLLNTASMSPIQPAVYSTPPANSSAPERVSLQVHAGSLGGAVEVSPVSFTPEAVTASRDRRMFTPANFDIEHIKTESIYVLCLMIVLVRGKTQLLSLSGILLIRPVGWILLRGVLLFVGSYFLWPALTQALEARASKGLWGRAPGNFALCLGTRLSQVPFPAL